MPLLWHESRGVQNEALRRLRELDDEVLATLSAELTKFVFDENRGKKLSPVLTVTSSDAMGGDYVKVPQYLSPYGHAELLHVTGVWRV